MTTNEMTTNEIKMLLRMIRALTDTQEDLHGDVIYWRWEDPEAEALQEALIHYSLKLHDMIEEAEHDS